jgi:hypothetical protein
VKLPVVTTRLPCAAGKRPVGEREVPEVVGPERQLVAVLGFAALRLVEQHTGVVDDRVETVQL